MEAMLLKMNSGFYQPLLVNKFEMKPAPPNEGHLKLRA